MYVIKKLLNGQYECRVRIQDGTECFIEPTLQKATFGVIKAARTLNGVYITVNDIEVLNEVPNETTTIADIDKVLLDKIKRNELVVLPHNDLRVLMKISPEECELIRRIREGELQLQHI